ncbi:hypothetical protein BH23PSE2_BH23PSE2_02250 [soil metagenome]
MDAPEQSRQIFAAFRERGVPGAWPLSTCFRVSPLEGSRAARQVAGAGCE